MLSQELLNELREILEQTCSRKFKKVEMVKIASDLCGIFELLAEASVQKNECRRDKRGIEGNK